MEKECNLESAEETESLGYQAATIGKVVLYLFNTKRFSN